MGFCQFFSHETRSYTQALETKRPSLCRLRFENSVRRNLLFHQPTRTISVTRTWPWFSCQMIAKGARAMISATQFNTFSRGVGQHTAGSRELRYKIDRTKRATPLVIGAVQTYHHRMVAVRNSRFPIPCLHGTNASFTHTYNTTERRWQLGIDE